MASRNVAKGALLPVAFNINELITFGFPIVFNPIMAIPFILVPVMAYFVSYFATEIGTIHSLGSAMFSAALATVILSTIFILVY